MTPLLMSNGSMPYWLKVTPDPEDEGEFLLDTPDNGDLGLLTRSQHVQHGQRPVLE